MNKIELMDGVIIVYPPDNLSRESVNNGFVGRMSDINIPAMNLPVEKMRSFLFELLKACDVGEELDKKSSIKSNEAKLQEKK